jgi:hypothetical protein
MFSVSEQGPPPVDFNQGGREGERVMKEGGEGGREGERSGEGEEGGEGGRRRKEREGRRGGEGEERQREGEAEGDGEGERSERNQKKKTAEETLPWQSKTKIFCKQGLVLSPPFKLRITKQGPGKEREIFIWINS